MLSNGGNITLGGGLNGTDYAVGTATSAMPTYGPNAKYKGVFLQAATLNAGGGNISIKGKGWQGANWNDLAADYYAIGVDVVGYTAGSSISTTGNGTITIDGVGGVNYDNTTQSVGINLYSGATANSLSTVNGALTLLGTNGSGTSRLSAGIAVDGGLVNISSTTGTIGFTADSVSLISGTNVSGGGKLVIQPRTAGTTIGLGTGSGTLSLASSLFSGGTRVFADGFSEITIGNSTAGNLTVGGALAFTDSTILQTNGNITLNAGASITNSQAAGNMVLAATGNFINNTTGTTALTTTGSTGRWLVYSAAPTNDVFGTLDSANGAVWNASYATMAPSAVTATGNRYLFTGTPSVTVTASATKIYGTALTSGDVLALSSSAGGSAVYTLPNLSDVFSVNPVATSSGLAATASVGGGPYAITVAPGTSNGSYSVTYGTPGTITVTPKALTVTGTTVANKVYDGGLVATLSGGSLVGVINSDTVSLAQAGSFASKNVANGISVTAADTLSGPQANNYMLTQPTSLTANITPKAITMTGLAANDKVYDGNTTAVVTGTAALSGSEAVGTGTTVDGKWYVGDTVSITGPPGLAAYGTFNSKNVAEANNVTFSGLSLTGAQAGNYTLTVQSPATAHITPKTVTLLASKTYDGTTNVAVTNWGQVNTGVGSETLSLNHGLAAFDSANAGNRTVQVGSYSLANGGYGGLASNYLLSGTSASANATISKAELKVVANNDAKFYGLADASGYYGVTYAGFVSGESASTLTTAPTVTRSNSSTQIAGTYTGVLVAAGGAATNYSFTYVNGNYTIVPAGQLLEIGRAHV